MSQATEMSYLKNVVDHVKNGGHSFCSNSGDQQFIRLKDDALGRWWPLGSRRIQAWIAKVGYELGTPLRQSEVAVVVEILRGLALEHELMDLLPEDLWRVAEKDPVVLAVLLFMQTRTSPWKGLVSELFGELKNQTVSSISSSPYALGKALRRSKGCFAKIGLKLSIKHTKLGTEVVLKGDPVTESSPNASPENSFSDNDFGQSDESHAKTVERIETIKRNKTDAASLQSNSDSNSELGTDNLG